MMFESLLQSDLWAEFKRESHWRSQRFGSTLSLEREVSFGFSVRYFPEMPFNDDTLELVRRLSVRSSGKRIFSRFEFFELWAPEKAAAVLDLGLIKSFEEVQPEYRQWVFLDQSTDKLLRQMKPKGRYNINLALRHRLKVEFGVNKNSISALTELYRQTSLRQRFSGRSPSYLNSLSRKLAAENLGEIIVVRKGDKPLSAILVSHYGSIISYLYGGSSSEGRHLMAPYLAHWEAMRWAKRRKAIIYDLLAIAPPDAANHPHRGLTRFKTQFGGRSVRLLGSWDLVESPFWYNIYRFLQKRRRGRNNDV